MRKGRLLTLNLGKKLKRGTSKLHLSGGIEMVPASVSTTLQCSTHVSIFLWHRTR